MHDHKWVFIACNRSDDVGGEQVAEQGLVELCGEDGGDLGDLDLFLDELVARDPNSLGHDLNYGNWN